MCVNHASAVQSIVASCMPVPLEKGKGKGKGKVLVRERNPCETCFKSVQERCGLTSDHCL